MSNSSEIVHPCLLADFFRHEWLWLFRLLFWGQHLSWSVVAMMFLQGKTSMALLMTLKMHLENKSHCWQTPTLFMLWVSSLEEGSLYSLIRQRLLFILFLWLKVSIKSLQKGHFTSIELSLCGRLTLLCWDSKIVKKSPSTFSDQQTDGNQNILFLCSCTSLSHFLSTS